MRRLSFLLAVSAAILLCAVPAQADRFDGALHRLYEDRASVTRDTLDQHSFAGYLHLSVGEDGTVYAHLVGRGDRAAREELRGRGFDIPSRYDDRRVFTARARIDALGNLDSVPGLQDLEVATRVEPQLDVSVPELFNGTDPQQYGLFGAGTVVGVVDIAGIDALHPDFIDPATSQSRVSLMWDFETGYQGDAASYCLANCCDCNPDELGHATHVASVAAGVHGVAPQAEIIGVGITAYLDEIIDGVNWIFENSGSRPCAINLGVGTHKDPHDGTGALDQALDEAVTDPETGLQIPGRVIVGAAGNNGAQLIHAGVPLTQRRQTFSIGFEVAAYVPNDGSQNDYVLMEGWHDRIERMNVWVEDPDGNVAGPFEPELTTWFHTPNGTVWVRNGVVANGDESALAISIQVYDGLADPANNPPKPGVWQAHFEVDRLAKNGNNRFDVWIYDSTMGSHFEPPYGDYETTIISPATSHTTIAVGAYTAKLSWVPAPGSEIYDLDGDGFVSYCDLGVDYDPFGDGCDRDYRFEYASFSSHGPTRDGRLSPHVTAPGVGIVAATSAGVADVEYIRMRAADMPGWDGRHNALQGTSTASPHVTGLAALLLESDPQLTAEEVKLAIMAGARPTGGDPNVWGAGMADASATLPE